MAYFKYFEEERMISYSEQMFWWSIDTSLKHWISNNILSDSKLIHTWLQRSIFEPINKYNHWQFSFWFLVWLEWCFETKHKQHQQQQLWYHVWLFIQMIATAAETDYSWLWRRTKQWDQSFAMMTATHLQSSLTSVFIGTKIIEYRCHRYHINPQFKL